MYLNNLSPNPGSKPEKQRVGRGIGSGIGKTCGKGHKGQKARAGGYHKVGFEGGQMPLQRRLPKMGFNSRLKKTMDQITLSELDSIGLDEININSLRMNGLISKAILNVKVILSGEITRPIKLKGIKATKGALDAINAAGGSVED